MTRRELIDLCLTFPGSVEDYPFEDAHCVLRRGDNRKWFALIVELEGRLCINLKCDPMKADFWRSVYKDCRPAWHMNKQHWNTIYLDGDVPQPELVEMIGDSFGLVGPRAKQRKKHARESEE